MFDTLPGLLANTLLTLLIVPQFIRLCKGKRTNYISLPLLLMVLPAASIWGVYGYLEQAIGIVIYSGLICALTFVFMVMFIKDQKLNGDKRSVMPYMRYSVK